MRIDHLVILITLFQIELYFPFNILWSHPVDQHVEGCDNKRIMDFDTTSVQTDPCGSGNHLHLKCILYMLYIFYIS